jgi:DNA replication protein DnaC
MPHPSKLLPVPRAVRHRLAASREAATWICPRCGEIAPLPVVGGFLRLWCACQIAARERQEMERLRSEHRQAQARLPYTWLGRAFSELSLQQKTFATFEQDRQPQAYEIALAFAASPGGILLLVGSFGVGKTHLLSAITNTQVARGSECLFASTTNFFDAIGERIARHEDYQALIRQATNTPLLLLDDLDKLKPSEFREETLYKIINGRTLAGRPLAVSANSPPEELVRWIGPAAQSRLMQTALVVLMQGSDYRLEGRGSHGA